MDGENNGKPYEQMDDLGGFPIFLGWHPNNAETSEFSVVFPMFSPASFRCHQREAQASELAPFASVPDEGEGPRDAALPQGGAPAIVIHGVITTPYKFG